MEKKFNEIIGEEDESGSGSQTGGGTSSGVEFRFDILGGETRDDLLSPEELKRLLAVHLEKHYDLVKKQKTERKNRQDIKEGKRPAVNNAYGVGNTGYGMGSQFKSHPITEKAYFSGIDKKVIGLASENVAETNQDAKNELENRLELKNRLQHQHAPKFNPTPRPL